MPVQRSAGKREVQQQERLGAQGASALELADEVALNRLNAYCRKFPEVVCRTNNLIDSSFFEVARRGGASTRPPPSVRTLL